MIPSVVDIAVSVGLVAAVLGVQLVATIDDPVGGADEGYLWYGVLEAARGKVPLRDFRSYEPGRYWVSLPFLLLGRGLPSVRVAATSMLGVGSLALALVVRGTGHGWPVVALSVVVIAAWSPVFQKRHDQAVLLSAAAAITWVVADPSTTSFLAAGLVVGLAFVFGVNLGLYAGVAVGLAVLIVARSPVDLLPGAGWLAVGAVAGAAPLWMATVAVRGFGRALLQRRVIDTTRRGSTNLALPIPVPWRRPPRQIMLTVGPIGARLASVLFVVVPLAAGVVVAIAGFGPADWAADNPVLVGTAVLTVPAWHHVTSRADIEHLSNVVAVPIVGLLAFADGGVGPLVVAIGVVIVVTAAVAVPRHPWVQRRHNPEAFVRLSILGRRALWFRTADAALIAAALQVRNESPADAPWLTVPMTLWVLPFLGRRSAVYNSFCVYPASAAVEEQMIAEIDAAAPPIAIVGLAALDGRTDLRFSATHPRVWGHLCAMYETAEVDVALPPSLVVLRRRGIAGQGTNPVSS